jgi:hypothetical protein
MSEMEAACEPTASKIETASDHRYGRRKPSRRTNVRNGREVDSITFEINVESSQGLPRRRRRVPVTGP